MSKSLFGNIIIRTTDEQTTDRFGKITIFDSVVRVECSFVYSLASEKYLPSKGIFFYPLSNIIEIEFSSQWHPHISLLSPEIAKSIQSGDLAFSDFHPNHADMRTDNYPSS